MLAERPLLSAPTVNASGVFFFLFRSVVAIRYPFFLIAIVMGSRRPPSLVPGWLIVVTLAVLLHELGHASVARFYGQDPVIELHAMGGTTSWQWRGAPRWHQRALISLAGPAAGFVAAGLVYAAATASAGAAIAYPVLVAIDDFLWVTIAWGVFNLLPILPLDGGAVVEALLASRFDATRARRVARIVSCGCGVLGAAFALAAGQLWAGALCALFTWNNLQQLRGGPAEVKAP